jgi:excisionase family DNA binding protein
MRTAKPKPTPPTWLNETIAAARGDHVSVVELAAALNLHPWTVRRYVREGRLETVKVGARHRITRNALERFLGADVAASA